jgi:hypothetical protein
VLEIWYDGAIADRRQDPNVVRVVLLVRRGGDLTPVRAEEVRHPPVPDRLDQDKAVPDASDEDDPGPLREVGGHEDNPNGAVNGGAGDPLGTAIPAMFRLSGVGTQSMNTISPVARAIAAAANCWIAI